MEPSHGGAPVVLAECATHFPCVQTPKSPGAHVQRPSPPWRRRACCGCGRWQSLLPGPARPPTPGPSSCQVPCDNAHIDVFNKRLYGTCWRSPTNSPISNIFAPGPTQDGGPLCVHLHIHLPCLQQHRAAYCEQDAEWTAGLGLTLVRCVGRRAQCGGGGAGGRAVGGAALYARLPHRLHAPPGAPPHCSFPPLQSRHDVVVADL